MMERYRDYLYAVIEEINWGVEGRSPTSSGIIPSRVCYETC